MFKLNIQCGSADINAMSEVPNTDSFLKRKVLVVDDDLFTLKMVSTALSNEFVVVNESSGSAALLRAQAEKPDLILLDLSMPNVDGYEVLSHLRNHPLLAAVPVICVSGKTDDGSRDRAYKAGASGFFQKPIKVNELSKDVAKLVESLNKNLISEDDRKKLFIGFNSTEVERQMKAEITSLLSQEKKVLVLSLKEGSRFFSHFSDSHLESQRLVFLQIKPNLMARLPYLEDLSIVWDELKELLPSRLSDYTLIFESPDLVIGNPSSERGSSTAMTFGASLGSTFDDIRYFCRYPEDTAMSYSFHQTCKILVG